jgi:hypothetical protein
MTSTTLHGLEGGVAFVLLMECYAGGEAGTVVKIVVWAYLLQAVTGIIVGGSIPWLIWFGWITPH